MRVLSGLEPAGVFYYFEEISGIPRGSYHEKAVSDYLVEFARKHNLECYQDEIYNVVMKVPASPGREQEEAVILQGHMDMVCEKNANAEIDMEKEGLQLAVDGDYVYGKETTLGGDDGIAIAYMLAIAEDETISHPPLEYIITVSEEVGMEGARGIDLSMLTAHQMLNLDSEEEGIFLSSCAGGMSTCSVVPIVRTQREELCWFTLTIDGLCGGHSGCEIHKERGNANKIMGRILYGIHEKMSVWLEHLEGGRKDNAIPRMATAVIGVKEEDCHRIEEFCDEMNQVLRAEYSKSDAQVRVELCPRECGTRSALQQESFSKVITLLMNLPDGVCHWSMAVPGLVETSLNLGIMRLNEDHLFLQHAIRSSVNTRKLHIADQVENLVRTVGGTMERQGEYPAWEYREESVVRSRVTTLYEKLYGKKPVVQGIHAGLECGLLAGKIPELDCVSMGPDILDIHTTAERLSISSTKRVYEFLLEYLKMQ